MKRSVRISIITLATATLLLLAAVLLAPWIIGQERIRETIAGALRDGAGLELTLESPPAMNLLPRPSLVLEGVALHAPGDERPLLQADRLDAALAVWPLLQGEVEAAVLRLTAPVLRLEKSAQGRWNLPVASGEDAEAEAAGLDFGPMAGALLEIETGTVIFEDKELGHTWRLQDLDLTLEARIQEHTVRLPRFSLDMTVAESPLPLPTGARLALDAEARFQAETGALDLVGFELTAMDSRLTLQGAVRDSFTSPSFDAELSLDAAPEDLRQILSLAQTPPPLKTRIRLSGDAQRLRLEELSIDADDSSLEGSGELELAPSPLLNLRLAADTLDGNALLLLLPAGDEEAPQALAPPGELLAWSREYAADVALELGVLRLPGVELTDVALFLAAGDGRISLSAPAFGLAEGTARFNAEAVLDQAGQTRFSLTAAAEGVDLAPLVADTPPMEEQVQGVALAKLEASGAGASWEQLLDSASGSLILELRDGSIPGAATDLEGQAGATLEYSLIQGRFTLGSANAPESAPQ